MSLRTRIFLTVLAGVAVFPVSDTVDAWSFGNVTIPLLKEFWPLLGERGSPNFLRFIQLVSAASAAVVGLGFGYLLSLLVPRPRWVGVVAFVVLANACLLLEAAMTDQFPIVDTLAVSYTRPAFWALFGAAVVCALRLRGGVDRQPGA
jgi:hypothetical protein